MARQAVKNAGLSWWGVLAAFGCAAVYAASTGWYGVGFDAVAGGTFWSPTLESLTINRVAPDSPAADQHVLKDDTVLEIQGVTVAGAKGDDLKKLRASIEHGASVGDEMVMKLRHRTGEVYVVRLVAAPRPPPAG